MLAALAALLPIGASAGCKAFAFGAVMWGKDPTRDVAAEWPHLVGKKVCVVVWAEMDTMFEYPFVQLEVARHVEESMTPAIKGISFVPPREVTSYQQRNPDWDREPPARIGAEFGADRVLFIEMTQYTTREPDSPYLFRGRISANLKVYDAAQPEAAPLYRSTVETVHPADTPGQYGTDDATIRKEAMEAFAVQVAGKFCDRREKL